MDHSEIISLLKQHYAELLEKRKARFHKEGPLPEETRQSFINSIKELDQLIQDNVDDVIECLQDNPKPEELLIFPSLQEIMEKFDLNFPVDSQEYAILKKQLKYAQRNYNRDVLAYNDEYIKQANEYSLLDAPTLSTPQGTTTFHKLKTIIDEYLSETEDTITPKSLHDMASCLYYLIELLGEDYNIAKLNGEKARYVKECLKNTPANRKKKKETRDLPLIEQLKVQDIPTLSSRTINKYLDYLSGLFKWSINNKYIKENPFEGMSLKDTKRGKRDDFSDEELAKIFKELEKKKNGRAKTDTRYWGTLLALYTGARRNEIASLTPDSVKHDKENDIHYLEIHDEKKSNRFKTAHIRFVPIHSDLIKRGFLEYVDKVRAMKKKDVRLLHELTYTKNHGWGKKLTHWFSDILLPELDLKTDKKSLHSTRHTFITRMKEVNTEYAIIDAIVGHEGRSISEMVYTHRSEKSLPIFRDAMERLEYRKIK